MASETRALESASHFVLSISSLEVFDGETQLLVDGSINSDLVLVFIENAYCSVIAVISILLGDETVSLSKIYIQ